MTPDQRAAWLADARAVLDAVEAHPELPVPFINDSRAVFTLAGSGEDAPRELARAEQALNAALSLTLTAVPDPDHGKHWYILQAALPGGLLIQIQAYAPAVADSRVTGTQVTDVTEWVRKPVPPEPGEDPEVSTT